MEEPEMDRRSAQQRATGLLEWRPVGARDITDIPCGRNSHTATLWHDALYVFGGRAAQGRLNDMRRFDLINARWDHLVPEGRPPRACSGRSAVLRDSHDTIYLFGGYDTDGNMHDDVCSFDLQSNLWQSQLAVKGDIPRPRINHVAWHFQDPLTGEQYMYVWSGLGEGNTPCPAMHRLHYDSLTWERVHTDGPGPDPLHWMTATVVGMSVYLYGGNTSDNHSCNQLALFNLSTHTWVEIPPNPRSEERPYLSSHTCDVLGHDVLLFFGGWKNSDDRPSNGHSNELWTYRISTNMWHELRALDPKPTYRGAHVSAVWRQRLVIFSGWDGWATLPCMWNIRFGVPTLGECAAICVRQHRDKFPIATIESLLPKSIVQLYALDKDVEESDDSSSATDSDGSEDDDSADAADRRLQRGRFLRIIRRFLGRGANMEVARGDADNDANLVVGVADIDDDEAAEEALVGDEDMND